MQHRNELQASNPGRGDIDTKRLKGLKGWSNWRRYAIKARGRRVEASYPEVPAGWPNRATRRAVKLGREHRLSSEWRQVLVQRPQLRLFFSGL